MFAKINKVIIKCEMDLNPKCPDCSGNPYCFSFKNNKIATDSGISFKLKNFFKHKKTETTLKVISVSYYILKEAASSTRINYYLM
jgi:hypothetical protein